MFKFYCRTHNVTACAVCAVQNHVTCKLDYIPDISLGYKDSSAYTRLKAGLNTRLQDVADFLKCTEENIQKTEDNGRDLIAEIRHCRHQLNHYLDKKETELIQEIEKQKQNDLMALSEIKDETMSLQLSATQTDLRKLETQNSDVLITCSDTETKMKAMKGRMDKYRKTNKPFIDHFTKSECSVNIRSSLYPLGTVTKVNEPYDIGSNVVSEIDLEHCQITIQQYIATRCIEDERSSYVTGITLLQPNDLLLTDWDNKCVKRVDTNTGVITAYLSPFYLSRTLKIFLKNHCYHLHGISRL